MEAVFQAMADLVAKCESFVLATIVDRKGSAPRSGGTKMLFMQDGKTFGTIGGGSLEANVEKLAAAVLAHHHPILNNFLFTGPDAASEEPICGGEVEILVEWLDMNDPELRDLLIGLIKSFGEHQKVWWVKNLDPHGKRISLGLVQNDGAVIGELPSGLKPEKIREINRPIKIEEYFIDPLTPGGTVYIFGAGYVSQSLAELTRGVGFYTVVLDDRAEFVSPERFTKTDRLVLLENFEDVFSQMEVNRDSYVVIVTRGHAADQMVLEQALQTSAGYIGMMGSRRKCKLIFDALLAEGYTETDIRRVHAPIGLAIEAETPEEIGISIVAELVQERAKNRKQYGS